MNLFVNAESFFRRQRMLARRWELMQQHSEITMASELAPLMGDLEREYWEWCLERFVAGEQAVDGKQDHPIEGRHADPETTGTAVRSYPYSNDPEEA